MYIIDDTTETVEETVTDTSVEDVGTVAADTPDTTTTDTVVETVEPTTETVETVEAPTEEKVEETFKGFTEEQLTGLSADTLENLLETVPENVKESYQPLLQKIVNQQDKIHRLNTFYNKLFARNEAETKEAGTPVEVEGQTITLGDKQLTVTPTDLKDLTVSLYQDYVDIQNKYAELQETVAKEQEQQLEEYYNSLQKKHPDIFSNDEKKKELITYLEDENGFDIEEAIQLVMLNDKVKEKAIELRKKGLAGTEALAIASQLVKPAATKTPSKSSDLTEGARDTVTRVQVEEETDLTKVSRQEARSRAAASALRKHSK